MLSLSVDIWRPVVSGASSLTAQVQALFAAGRVGGMWDMGDTSTLYQTFWASTSVTAPNDPIGAVLDKSRPEQDKTAAFIAGAPTGVTGSSITKSGAVLTLSGSAINDEVRFDTTFASDDTYAYCEFTASGSGQILVYAGGSPVAFTLTGSPVACRASMTSNGSGFLVFRAVSAGVTGTITVTKVGARKGNHATQSTAGSRSLYQVDGGYGCAQFDGANDLLQVAGINLSTTDKFLFGMAFKSNSAAVSIAAEYSPNVGGNNGSFYTTLNASGTGVVGVQVNNGGVIDAVTTTAAIPAANATYVQYVDLALAAAVSKITGRVNGASAAFSLASEGADTPGNLGNHSLFIGARSGGSFPSNMNLYRAFIRAGSATAGDQLIFENWLRESCGV